MLKLINKSDVKLMLFVFFISVFWLGVGGIKVSATEIDSVISNNKLLSEEKAILESETGVKYLVDLYETNNIALKKFSPFYSVTPEYIKEVQFSLSPDKMTKIAPTLDTSITTFSGNISKEEWHSTGGTTGSITLYYNQKVEPNGTKYLINQMTAKVTIRESGTYFRGGTATVACNEGFSSSQTITRSFVSSPLNIVTGFTKYANADAGLVAIGGRFDVKLQRASGSSWNFVVNLPVANNLPAIGGK